MSAPCTQAWPGWRTSQRAHSAQRLGGDTTRCLRGPAEGARARSSRARRREPGWAAGRWRDRGRVRAAGAAGAAPRALSSSEHGPPVAVREGVQARRKGARPGVGRHRSCRSPAPPSCTCHVPPPSVRFRPRQRHTGRPQHSSGEWRWTGSGTTVVQAASARAALQAPPAGAMCISCGRTHSVALRRTPGASQCDADQGRTWRKAVRRAGRRASAPLTGAPPPHAAGGAALGGAEHRRRARGGRERRRRVLRLGPQRPRAAGRAGQRRGAARARAHRDPARLGRARDRVRVRPRPRPVGEHAACASILHAIGNSSAAPRATRASTRRARL